MFKTTYFRFFIMVFGAMVILVGAGAVINKSQNVVVSPRDKNAQKQKMIADAKSYVEKGSANDLYRLIGSKMVRAFSKDYLIKGGLEDADLEAWDVVIAPANEVVKREVAAGKSPAEYKTYIETLNKMYGVIKKSVADLHGLYAKAYVKKGDKIGLDVSTTAVSEDGIKKINEIQKEAAYYLSHAHAFVDNTLNNIPVPEEWRKELYASPGVIKDAADVFKSYKKFLESYKEVGKSNFNEFMRNNAISNLTTAENIFWQLEKIEFIMQEKLKTDKNPQERKDNLALVQEIMKKIKERFPEITSSKKSWQLIATTDKPSIILFAQAGAYEGVLTQLLREIAALKNELNFKLDKEKKA